MQRHSRDLLSFQAALASELAIVLEPRGRGWLVELDASGDRRIAAVAPSCMLEPRAGDSVCLVYMGDRAFILAILERSAGAGAVLNIGGDLEIRTGGNVTIDAGAGLRTRSATLQLEAKNGHMLFGRIDIAARSVYAYLRESTVVGSILDTLVDRVAQHCRTSYRAVTSLDYVSAGNLDYRAEGTAHVHGQNTMLSASELAKVDASQIHLG